VNYASWADGAQACDALVFWYTIFVRPAVLSFSGELPFYWGPFLTQDLAAASRRRHLGGGKSSYSMQFVVALRKYFTRVAVENIDAIAALV